MRFGQIVASFLIQTAFECYLQVIDNGVQWCPDLVGRVGEEQARELTAL